MSELLTQSECEENITIYYQRLKTARLDGSTPNLVNLFEHRMNEAIDMWGDFQKFAGRVALVTDTEQIESD